MGFRDLLTVLARRVSGKASETAESAGTVLFQPGAGHPGGPVGTVRSVPRTLAPVRPDPEKSLGLSREVAELSRRIAHRSGEPEMTVAAHLRNLGNAMSMDALNEVARGAFSEAELDTSIVKHRIRRLVNSNTRRYTHCTGGASAIEISPNGRYTRCPKFASAGRYTAHLMEPGPIRVLDTATDDMSCNIRCPQQMCFTRNVLRATSLEEFEAGVAREGIRGVYAAHNPAGRSDVFIRWKLTDVCNYTCAYCTDWRSVNKKGAELTDAEMLEAGQKILDQFGKISMRLTGGEPSARRAYVDLMRLFHSRLDQFTDIEIRTNLSYQDKHKEILGWDWQGKLHLHVGCHIRDKNFHPWRMIEVMNSSPKADYVLKFVATNSNREHVEYFRDYFLKGGIPSTRILVTQEVGDKLEDDAVMTEVPFARRMIETNAGRLPGMPREKADERAGASA